MDTVAGRELVIAASTDASVAIWTMRGGLVGVFGQHEWRLDDPATWQVRAPRRTMLGSQR